MSLYASNLCLPEYRQGQADQGRPHQDSAIRSVHVQLVFVAIAESPWDMNQFKILIFPLKMKKSFIVLLNQVIWSVASNAFCGD